MDEALDPCRRLRRQIADTEKEVETLAFNNLLVKKVRQPARSSATSSGRWSWPA